MSALPTSLSLPDRTGLPDAVAYLRGTYPATGWRGHGNFGELANFWLHVHQSLRGQTVDLTALSDALRARRIDVAAFQQGFVPRFNQFLQHLNGHHSIEDAAYFPKFRALDPRMVVGFDLLENDHGIIHAGIEETLGAARGLTAAFGTGERGDGRAAADYAAASARLFGLLDRHLADEEDLVIPAMLEHGERALH